MNLGPKHISKLWLPHYVTQSQNFGQENACRSWAIRFPWRHRTSVQHQTLAHATLQVFSLVEIYWTDNYACIPGCYFHLSPSCIFFHWIQGPTVSPHMVVCCFFRAVGFPSWFQDAHCKPIEFVLIGWWNNLRLQVSTHFEMSTSTSVYAWLQRKGLHICIALSLQPCNLCFLRVA